MIYLQFDNTHYNRDATNVASDLEQMPHLLSFLKNNGTLFTNDHTILISHTAGGILSSLTGLYPDRQGQTVSNSYDYYPASKVPAFTSSFKYWTAPVDPVNDPLPNMITDTGKTTPAPWVPFTRAGCDVGGVGTANIELENNSTAATGDITKVFGSGSSEWNETVANPQLGQTDFVGIAIHCSQSSTSVCSGNGSAKPDLLPDEPGGYTGFNALYGVEVRRSGDHARQAVRRRHVRRSDHGPGRQLRLPGLRRDAREEHARLRRADAGVGRPGHVRLHLGRA